MSLYRAGVNASVGSMAIGAEPVSVMKQIIISVIAGVITALVIWIIF